MYYIFVFGISLFVCLYEKFTLINAYNVHFGEVRFIVWVNIYILFCFSTSNIEIDIFDVVIVKF